MARNIYYLCPCDPKPCGGVQKIYQHVDALNRAGISALVLHQQDGYRYPWRQNQTRLAYFDLGAFRAPYLPWLKASVTEAIKGRKPNIPWQFLGTSPRIYTTDASGNKVNLPKLDESDIVVLPDFWVAELHPLFAHIPTVLLNFTAYLTFQGISIEQSMGDFRSLPYDSRALGCIVGSADTANYLRFTYPNLPIHICQFGVDVDQFSYHPQKKKQMAFMPRKCRDHLVQVINILRQRNKLPGWTFMSLEKKPQDEVIKQVQTSAVYLSTSYMEGFGLPPAEALSGGSLVVGYDGEGGREFFHEPFAHAIPHGNIIEFVKKAEELAMLYDKDPQKYQEIGKKGSEYIRSRYSIENEDKSVIKAWQSILGAK